MLYPFHHTNPRSLTVLATRKQTTIPVTVGITNDSSVHFKLCVSFLIVRQVVPQGQCRREKSMTQTAVSQVHP